MMDVDAPGGPAGELPTTNGTMEVDEQQQQPPSTAQSAFSPAPSAQMPISLLTPSPPARHSYTPQFSSSSTQAILQRYRTSSNGINGIAKHHATSILVNGATTPPSEEADLPRTMPMPVRKKAGRGRNGVAGDNDNDNDSDNDTIVESPASSNADSYAHSISSFAALMPVCTVCERPARSLFNPLVPCRRCSRRWHRLCHEPVIADYVAAAAAAEAFERLTATTDSAASAAEPDVNGATATPPGAIPVPPAESAALAGWSCPSCTAAAAAEHTERLARRARADRPEGSLRVTARPPPATHHNLAGQTPQQRRTYVACLPRPDLQQWLLYAMEKHPDLAVFPPSRPRETAQMETEKAASRRGRPPRSSFLPPLPASMAGATQGNARVTAAAVVAATRRDPAYRHGIINSIRKKHAASVAEAERIDRAEKIAAGLPVPPRRGRPPKVQPQQPVLPQLQPPLVSMQMQVLPGHQPAPRPPRPARPKVVDPSHIPAFVPTPVDPDEEDPTGLMAAWPKPGQGLYARVGPDWEVADDGDGGNGGRTGAVLVESKDHASFSSMVFNNLGRKVRENGQPVLVL